MAECLLKDFVGSIIAIVSDNNAKIIYKKFWERNKLNNFIIVYRYRQTHKIKL